MSKGPRGSPCRREDVWSTKRRGAGQSAAVMKMWRCGSSAGLCGVGLDLELGFNEGSFVFLMLGECGEQRRSSVSPVSAELGDR